MFPAPGVFLRVAQVRFIILSSSVFATHIVPFPCSCGGNDERVGTLSWKEVFFYG